MADFSKLQIRFSNMGLNVAHTASSLEYGQWQIFKNARSEYEGQVTARLGFTVLSSLNGAGSPIIGIKRLNNSVNGQQAYFCRTSAGKLFVSYTKAAGSGGVATITAPFYLQDSNFNSFTNLFGSFVVERPSLSASTWLYLGDRSAMYKFTIKDDGTVQAQSIGMKRPTGPPTLVVQADGSLTANSLYNYRYTLYDKTTGMETLYNSTEATAASTTGVNMQIQVTIPTETINPACSHVRVYRSGGTITSWNRISDDGATFAYTGSTINFVDAAADLSIANSTLLDTLSDQPFSITQKNTTVLPGQSLPYLFGPYLGYILAVGDPNNPGLMYWMNKFNPDAQNPANNVEVTSPQDPLQNGFIYNGLAYTFSKEGLYALYPGVTSSTFTPSKTSCSRGLWTPQAFCLGPQVYFLSKDGIYATAGGLESAMTDNELRPIFDPKQTALTINGIGVVDYSQTSYMFLAYYKNEVWFQYLGKDGNTHILIYDVRYHRWRHIANAIGATIRSLYSDEEGTASIIMGGNDGHLYNDSGFSDAGIVIPVEVRTGLMTLGAPLIHKQFGSLILDLDTQGATVTVNAYSSRGATLIDNGGFTGQVTGGARQRMFIDLKDTFSEDLLLDFSWSAGSTRPILYGYELLYKQDVTQLNKWSTIGTNHGLPGWQILRSGYFTYRSDGTLTLTITLEGQSLTYTYTLPSTGNNKQKVFVPFDPIKGKLFTYKLAINSATYFRFYPEESEVHVKPWISSFGYSASNPFRGGGEMPDFSSGGGGGQGQSVSMGDGSGGGGGGGSFAGGGGAIPGFDFSGFSGGLGLGPGVGTPTNPANPNIGTGNDADPGRPQLPRDNGNS